MMDAIAAAQCGAIAADRARTGLCMDVKMSAIRMRVEAEMVMLSLLTFASQSRRALLVDGKARKKAWETFIEEASANEKLFNAVSAACATRKGAASLWSSPAMRALLCESGLTLSCPPRACSMMSFHALRLVDTILALREYAYVEALELTGHLPLFRKKEMGYFK